MRAYKLKIRTCSAGSAFRPRRGAPASICAENAATCDGRIVCDGRPGDAAIGTGSALLVATGFTGRADANREYVRAALDMDVMRLMFSWLQKARRINWHALAPFRPLTRY